MSRIDELIQERSAPGVEYAAIGELVVRSEKMRWDDFDQTDEFRYIDLGTVDRVTHSIKDTEVITKGSAPSRAQQVVREGDVLFGTTRPMLKRYCVVPADYNGEVASTGFCVLRVDTDRILTNFLFHLLGTSIFYEYVEANERGASYPAISDKLVKKFRIPVPPLEVQREIVRVLDKFTQLEAELEAELEARRAQYAHYRRELLSGGDAASGRMIPLGEIFEMRAGTHIKAAEISDEPTEEKPYPCYGGNGLRGYVSSYNYDESVIFVGRQGALCGNVHRAEGKTYATEHAVVVTPKVAVDMSWAFHKLTEMDLNQYKTKSAQPGLAVGRVKQVEAQYVPVDDQRRDGEVLDKLDALVNDISIGLPAELTARRKQYEYYRDHLLSFKEVV